MIIYGFQSRESTTRTGQFVCPRCQSVQPYHLIMVRRWFSLFFIPVLPLSRLGQYVQCTRCAGTFSDEILSDYSPNEADVLVATLAEPAGMGLGLQQERKESPRITNSGWATLSLIMGLISPLFVCLCGLSLVTSLAAIVSGHVALLRIRQAKGMLEGRGLAITGLILGYLLLPISAVSIYVFAMGLQRGWERAQQRELAEGASDNLGGDAETRLSEAELKIFTSSRGIAHGNTAEARALAETFAKDMQTLRETLFTERDRVLSLTNDQFVTYCELQADRCAFVVHVPDYRKFTDEAKESLAMLAWRVAENTAAKKLKPGDSLAVGLKGSILYGSVLVGEIGADANQEKSGQEADRDALLAFFAPTSNSESTLPVDSDSRQAVPAESSLAGGPSANSARTSAEAQLPDQPELRGQSEPAGGMSSTAGSEPRSPFGMPAGAPPRTGPSPIAPPQIGPPSNRPPQGVPFPPSMPPVPGPIPTPFPPPFPNPPFAGGPMPGANPVPGVPPVASSIPNSTPARSAGGTPAAPADATAPSLTVKEQDGESPVQLLAKMGWGVKSLAFSPDSRWLAVGKADRACLLFELESGRQLASLSELGELGEVSALAFTRDGKQIYVGGGTGAIQMWNVDATGQLKLDRSLTGHSRAVRCLAARDDVGLLVSGGEDKRVMWQQTKGSRNMRVEDLFQSAVQAVLLPAQGTQLLASDGRKLAWINMRNAATERSLDLVRGAAHAVAFSPDGTRIACSDGYQIRVWETETGKELSSFDAIREIHWSLQFTPDGKQLVSGGRGKAYVWEVGTDNYRTLSLGGVLYVQTLAISSNGRWLAAIPSAAGQSLHIFSLAPPRNPSAP